MDFIEGLPKSIEKDVILVVVDRLTKYAHFLALAHPYSVQQVTQIFMDNVFKLHGMPTAIITKRDTIFTSKLFQDIFKSLKVSLRFIQHILPPSNGWTNRKGEPMFGILLEMYGFPRTKGVVYMVIYGRMVV